MHLLLTGATGFIGSAVLRQALSHPQITTITLLSRREVGASLYHNNSKVRTVIVKDFANYTEEVVNEIKDADACVWCMGSNGPDVAVNLTYPMKFVEAMAGVLSGGEGVVIVVVLVFVDGCCEQNVGKCPPKQFRYIHLGGAFCVRDQNATGLWFLEAPRKIRGNAEAQVLAFATSPIHHSQPYKWETIVFRPGGVYGGTSGVLLSAGAWLMGDSMAVHCDELGAAMVGVAVSGYKGKGSEVYGEKTVENLEIVTMGREILARRT
ncbi:hypothetical protein HDV00_004660 [Rhizophlyctis rosea]|nr:hypothetical protein HDV00_004660 [Rhizophlyctis rosea]